MAVAMRLARPLLSLIPFTLVAASPALALDVTGEWTLSSGGLTNVMQSGTSISFGVFSGTIDGQGVIAASGSNGLCQMVVDARVVGETRMIGMQYAQCAPSPTIFEIPFRGMRCECSDGNGVDGDGCDASCQLEPCFTCAGAPSVCTPSSDGATCDDRSECTTGETCSAGTCGGGSPVAQCIDLTGEWVQQVSAPLGHPNHPATEYGVVEIAQIGTILEFNGMRSGIGVINPMTGAMTRAIPGRSPLCPGGSVDSGTTDGQSFTLDGADVARTATQCVAFPLDVAGTRCDGPCAVPTTSTSTTVSSTTTSTSTTSTTLPRQLLAGNRLTMKDNVNSARRGLTVDSKDTATGLGGGNGSSDDPTIAGATLRVRTADGCGGACDATYQLPASGWRVLGENAGYQYSDRTLAVGPVKTVTVRPGKGFKAVAKGAQLTHQLAASPVPVDVVLTLGTLRSCLQFGGTVRFTAGKKLTASKAPAPGGCP